MRRLLATWILGAVVGTLAVAITSPLFVRSYVPLRFDSLRGAWTYGPGHHYRWRSEGYATTLIGPHGMPGRSRLRPDRPATPRVALWGDSQTEGVCVADHQKLFAQAERSFTATDRPTDFLPLARSGQSVADWLPQFASVERELGVDLHVLVIVELADLLSAIQPSVEVSGRGAIARRSGIAASVPAFLIQALRYLVTDANDNPRRLRFSVGPPETDPIGRPATGATLDWTRVCQTIADTTDRPIVILYAPNVPHVAGGKIVLDDGQSDQLKRMKRAAKLHRLGVVDMSQSFRRSALEGRWPRGFHNGQIGNGHLNVVGYQLIATELADAIGDRIDRKD